MAQNNPTQKLYPFNGSVRRTAAMNPNSKRRKFKTMVEIMAKAKHVGDPPFIEIENNDDHKCEECGSGENGEEILLCDKCDKRFHMGCTRPVVVRVPFGPWVCPLCSRLPRVTCFTQKKIIDFFRIQKCKGLTQSYTTATTRDTKKRRKRLVCYKKKRRRLLPFVPTNDPSRRLEQMRSLATALTALKMKFSNELTYFTSMAPKSANQAIFENGGMQVLSKEDYETVELCRSMASRGECAPLIVVYDTIEGYTVEADGPIKDMTLIGEYTGDVDYLKNREHDDCDGLMTLLLTTDPSKSLVICPDKRGNIARFINGINNHTPESKKKQNLKCVRYDVNGECRVFLVATRDIAKGERLYYDYNGYEHEYPTQHFI